MKKTVRNIKNKASTKIRTTSKGLGAFTHSVGNISHKVKNAPQDVSNADYFDDYFTVNGKPIGLARVAMRGKKEGDRNRVAFIDWLQAALDKRGKHGKDLLRAIATHHRGTTRVMGLRKNRAGIYSKILDIPTRKLFKKK